MKQGLFFRFCLERDNFNLELPDQWYLLACGQMSSLSCVQSTFDWGERKWRWLGMGLRCRDWWAIAIQVSLKKHW